MKKLLFSGLAVIFTLTTFGQRVCGTAQHEEFLNKKDPKRAEQRKAFEKKIQDYVQNNPNKTAQSIIQIPLVVHMVYSSATDSITDAQIFSQIQILNDDYTRQNADAANTPAPFAAVASAPMVNYCWAQQDPNGNPTTGIERRKSATTSWTTDDKVKSFATGGLDAWDPSRYFNIWVCNLGGGLLGYGEFPTSSVSSTYGFVAGYFCFGNIGKVNPPYDKGRTATHEIGHCFDLLHIWGDDGGACTGDDLCADTPNQAAENYGCPTYPHTDACATSSPGVMFMNYMDYTDDACMNTFTANQSTRMVAIVNNAPYNSLATSNGCTPIVLQATDAGTTTILQPNGNLCAANIIPQIVVKNWGTNTLTSASIKYKVDNGTLQSQAWSGSLVSLATTTVTLGSVAVTTGSHTLTVYTTLPNGGADGNNTNDTANASFTVVGVGAALPLVEGFEGGTYPPAGWTIYNPDNATTWAKTSVAAKSGANSIFMDNYNYNASKQQDAIITPALDMTTVVNPVLTFQLAYQMYTDPSLSPNYSDTLNVMVSSNCGTTYTSLYKKFGVGLATTTPAFSTTQFTPTSSQWRLEIISLGSVSSSNAAFVKFLHTTDYENQMYIDDINIMASNGIKTEAALAGVLIYPNPSADGKFLVDIKKDQHDVNKLSVFDMLGNKVYGIDQKIPTGFYDMNLSNLPNGTYFVEIIKDNKPLYTKIVINK